MSIDSVTARLLHQALTGSADELAALIPAAQPEVVRAVLRNPVLTESHLLQLLQRADLTEDILKSICRLSVAESSHNLKVALARHPRTPGAQLLTILPHLYLFELLNLCIMPDITPDQKLAAERIIIQRLPATPLGNRLTLARRATPAVLEALLKEGDSRLVEICLSNPRLKEGAVFMFLRSGKADAESISLVARHPRWQSRPNIREAVLTNPKTPLVWFNLWLPAMKTVELRRLLSSNRLNGLQRKEVENRLKGQ
jgi:hypothetical protein